MVFSAFSTYLDMWSDNHDGRGMLIVNQFLKITSTFPTEKMRILSPGESLTPKGLKLKKKTLCEHI